MTPTPGITVAQARAALGDELADWVIERASQVPPMGPELRRQVAALLATPHPGVEQSPRRAA